MSDLAQAGWQVFPFEQGLRNWVEAAAPHCTAAVGDPELRRQWLRCGGTWFVGVNALANDGDGRVKDGPPLECAALDAARAASPHCAGLDRGQVSVCYPGYPRRDPDESEAAHRFRRHRDAAHLDGLLRRGAAGRRHFLEHHSFILGLPVNDCPGGASPLVVWEGSQDIMAGFLRRELAGLAPEDWAAVDVTQAYVAARREVFARCRRVEVHAAPGQAYLVHRFALHGVAPWREGAHPRTIIYFRPTVAALHAAILET